jgi:uncharacterized protein YegJ (DUF2314 family)
LVRVPRCRLNDWLFTRGDDSVGGFTVKLFMDQLHPDEDS